MGKTRFSADFIERVREATDLVSLISGYTDLKPKGHNLFGLCPFPDHHEKTASFSVSQLKQFYFCFGCKKSGNAFTFLSDLQGLSFPEAVEQLAGRAGISIEDESSNPIDRGKEQSRSQATRILSYAQKLFVHELKSLKISSPVYQYAASRGLLAENLSDFHLGYAPDAWDAFANQLRSKGDYWQAAERIGLLRRRPRGEGYYDIFRNRLMFPIIDHKGDTIGFGGRAVGEDQQPKYLNSPESFVFDKSRVLYGYFQNAKYIKASGYAVVVEGYMDVIGLSRIGIHQAVACMGTAFTAAQARLLRRLTQKIVFAFDNDTAGHQAAERALPIALAADLHPQVLDLGDFKDPDEWAQGRGTAEAQQLIENSPDMFLDQLVSRLKKAAQSPGAKVEALAQLEPAWRAINDPRLRELYFLEMADAFGFEKNWLSRHLAQPQTQSSKPNEVRVNRREGAEDRKTAPKSAADWPEFHLANLSRLEWYLLGMALTDPDRFKELNSLHRREQVSRQVLLDIMDFADSHCRQHPDPFASLPAYLSSFIKPSGALIQFIESEIQPLQTTEQEKLFKDCLLRLETRFLKNKSQQLARQMRLSTNKQSEDELEQIMNIQRHRLGLKEHK